jgi:Flp pilus assembly pilin Flp
MRGQPEERDAMSRLLLKWTRTIAERTRGRYDDRGAGFVEYAGLLVLIATIVVAVVGLDLNDAVSDAIRDAVGDILGSD